MWRLSKHAALFAVGAIAYFEIELHWRYFAGTLPVHWTMPILGGVLFLLLGGLNEWLPWEMPFWGQCLLGAAMVTAAEFAAGCVLNLWLGLGRVGLHRYAVQPDGADLPAVFRRVDRRVRCRHLAG